MVWNHIENNQTQLLRKRTPSHYLHIFIISNTHGLLPSGFVPQSIEQLGSNPQVVGSIDIFFVLAGDTISISWANAQAQVKFFKGWI